MIGQAALQLRNAWVDFLAASNPAFAVSLAYNNRYNGTSSACYRLTPEGEYKLLRSHGTGNGNDNRLPTIRYIPPWQVQADLRSVHRDVDRHLFGCRFNRLGSIRTHYTGFIENADENIHAHVGWTVPASRNDEFVDVLRNAWLKTSPHVSIQIVPVRDKGWAEYICNTNAALLGDPSLFVSDGIPRP